MIIACPACATRYVVPDSAIGVEGRTVRCAKCKHAWFQDGPEVAEPIAAAYATPGEPVTQSAPAAHPPGAPVPAPASAPAPVAGPAPAPSTISPPSLTPRPQAPPPAAVQAPVSTPEPAQARVSEEAAVVPGLALETGQGNQERAVASAEVAPSPIEERTPLPVERPIDAPRDEPVFPEDDVSQFEHGPPFRPRRNWLRWITWGAGAFAALALAAVVAMQTLGLPSWLPIEQPLFGADPGLKVEFPPSEQERRTLPNGTEFFGAQVVVRNEARETRSVPPLLIVLRDARERVVYSWELVPPQRTLAPGEAMTINEAMTDVPKSAVYADIGWAPR